MSAASPPPCARTGTHGLEHAPHDSVPNYSADPDGCTASENLANDIPARTTRRTDSTPLRTKARIMITPHSQSTDRSTIESLIAALDSRDGLKRQDARAELVERGHECVADLIRALKHPQEQVRWEAAKALVTIADPAATAALADALSDEDGDVRWLAAQGLITLGRNSVWPVLERLTHRAGSEKFREAAHHVLHAHFDGELDELLAPVLGALDGPSPETGAPVAAYEALRNARRGNLPFGVDDG